MTKRREEPKAPDRDLRDTALAAAMRLLHALWIAIVLVVGLMTLIAVLAKRPAVGSTAPLGERQAHGLPRAPSR